MKRTRRRKEKRNCAKSILRDCPTSRPRNPRSSTAFLAPMPSAAIGMQLTNSLSGAAPSRGCRSAKR